MDALIAAIMEMPHAGNCGFLIERATGKACSCGVHDLMRDAVIVRADLAVDLSDCRTKGLDALKDLLEKFKTE